MKNVIIYVMIATACFWSGGAPIAFSLDMDLANSPFLSVDASKKISMDFKNADLNDVLKIFSQQSGLNFIAADEITQKKITLYLDKVPVDAALDRILLANSLAYETVPGSDIIIVKPLIKSPERITRIYHLRNATVESSRLKKTIEIDTVRDDATSSSDTQNEDSESGTTGIVAAIKAVLSTNGSIVEDPRTNSVIVTDVAIQFPVIEKTIARLDVAVPMILIEVEMLDVSKNDADQLGIKYGNTPLTFTGGLRNHLYPFSQNDILNSERFAFDPSAGSEDGEFSVGTLSAAGLTATLQFLNTLTETKNLARPRILTLNNETAEIKIATNEAIGIQTSTDAAQGVATQTVEAERVQTGVFLTVTPQADIESGEITMAISPKVIQARTGATFSGQSFKDPEERGTRSILRIKDGETIVLGGLLRTDDTDTRTKLPILGDIPLIGSAFRHKDKTKVDRELIIFITPRVITGNPETKRTAVNAAPIIREQDHPSARTEAIEKELITLENRRL